MSTGLGYCSGLGVVLACPDHCQYGDVVFLAELLRGPGNGIGRLVADALHAREAVEFAAAVAGLQHAVRDKRQAIVLAEAEGQFGIVGLMGDPERKAGIDLEFFAVEVGRQMTGVGDGGLRDVFANRVDGFAVVEDDLPAALEVTHRNLNDRTIEGVRHRELPAFSVQYHPEASAGPHDSDYLFNQFRELIAGKR